MTTQRAAIGGGIICIAILFIIGILKEESWVTDNMRWRMFSKLFGDLAAKVVGIVMALLLALIGVVVLVM